MLVKSIAGLILFAGLVLAQEEALGPNGQPKPEPYSFSYSADSAGGVASHQETGDGTGRITGVYTINGPDGRERRVEYVADAQGYRAVVKTNEIGTKPEDSGDARFQVSQPSDAQLNAANNANSLNPNSQQNSGLVAGLANQRPQANGAEGQQQQLVDSSANSPRPSNLQLQQQQQEQIPSANSQSLSTALAPGSAADEQQQTLVNLDDIQDQPPQDIPQPQLVQIVQQPQQQQISPFQQQQFAQGPIPTANFQPIAPTQPARVQQILEVPQQPEQPQQQILIEAPQPQQVIIQQAPVVEQQSSAAAAAAKGRQPQPLAPQQQLIRVDEQPGQQQVLIQGPQQPAQQQVFFQGPQQQQALQPIPAPTFAARQPQQPVIVVQQPQQFSQQNEQQQQNEESEADNQPQAPAQPLQPQLISGPSSSGVSAAAKGQQAGPQLIELSQQPIGPGSAGQRGPQPIQQLVQLQENQFGPRAPQQPILIEQQQLPQQQIQLQQPQQQIQFQPANFGPLPVQQPEQQQIVQIAPQPQLVQAQQAPLQIIEQQQPSAGLAPVNIQGPQLVAIKGSGAVKGAGASKGIQGPARTGGLQQQQLIAVPAPQQPIIQRFEPLPQQPQLIQQFQPAPQQQIINIPQQQQQQQLIPQAPRQPQLIQVPLEQEIQVPNFNIERINPPRANLQPGALAVQPAAKGQQQVNFLPTQGLRVEPIFKQVTVAAPQPAQQQQVLLQQQEEQALSQGGAKGAELLQPQIQALPAGAGGALAKGQVEVISLKETEPKQSEQTSSDADSGKSGESDSDSQDNGSSQGGDSQQGNNDSDDENQQQQQTAAPIAPPTTTTTTTTTTTQAPAPQRPVGRLVFGKTRFGVASGGVKIGTKSAVAAAQPVRQQQVLVPVVQPQPQLQLQQQPQPIKSLAPNQFISFGTRLGTKSS